MALIQDTKIAVLVGGVGGAKLALGLQQVLPPENLTVIVNTGDDFWHYGLRICPDLDTVLYTLSGRVDPVNGWGVADDTRVTLGALRNLGEDPWFGLGDRDIATHLLRTHLLRAGYSLSDVIQRLAQGMGVQPKILPMTDEEVATRVDTVEHGELEFQEYFVRHRWQPVVKNLRYVGAEKATLSPAVREALQEADVILIGPSNPWLSIAPILAIPGLRQILTERLIPRVAVTPIVEGRALKGPAAKLMGELGYEVSARVVAEYYGDVINRFIYDERDTPFQSGQLRLSSFDTIMQSTEDKARLARQILDWVREMEVL